METTGLDKSFDQVLEFAAIRTDRALNEIERHHIEVQLTRDSVPAPQALMTHRIPLAIHHGEREDVAVRRIHGLLNKPGTYSGGYNTLGFDDELLRFSFYRHMFTPYTHQYANGCGRFDLYPMVVLYALYQPDVLAWPSLEDGTRSLRLDAISELNDLAQGAAHRAMTDVEATIALAKRLAQHEAMWSYALGYFDKAMDQQRLRQCETSWAGVSAPYPLALMVHGRFGAKANYMSPVMYLGQHEHYKNQGLWLRLDAIDFSEKIDGLEGDKSIFNQSVASLVCRKKWAEPGLVLPLSPRHIKVVSEQRQQQLVHNLQWLAQREPALALLRQSVLKEPYPAISGIDMDAGLYQSEFQTQGEIQWAREFYLAPDETRESLLPSAPTRRLRMQAIRWVWRYMPDALSDADGQALQSYVQGLNARDASQRLINYRGELRRAPWEVQQQISGLLEEGALDAEQKGLLNQLGRYLSARWSLS